MTVHVHVHVKALVNVLLRHLATLALDRVKGEFNLVIGVEEEVKTFTFNLESIEAVLEDAEQRQVTDASVKLWLSRLNEVSYEMDDVLDEWITRVLMKQQMEKEGNFFEVLSSFISLSWHRRDIAMRIKCLNKRLDLIEKSKRRFNFQKSTRDPELPERQKTTSLPGDKTFGRDKEKSVILGKLLSKGSQEKGAPLIIPIVGMGGMGKTTLAQLVYNDEKVKTNFDKRVWVCVSDPFEEIKIAKAIVEGLDKSSPSRNSNELQALLQCILELIKGKKLFLVLDDVWSPKLSQWEELIKPLRDGAMGSRILVTTRKEEVANLMNATAHMIHLNQLNEEFCLSLFYYHAEMDETESGEFQAIGKEIVKTCNRLPLAAKTLGRHMRDKKTIKEWQDVLNSKIWQLEDIEMHVFRPLLLSYHDLASTIKRCLLYCVTFPKNYVFDKENLIELWMAQDYLNAKGSKDMKIIGQTYFDILAMRSFFQDFKVNAIGETRCKMHNIVHDFLQYLTKNECYTMDYCLGTSERMEEAIDKVHHLTLLNVDGRVSLYCFRNCKNLRTLAALDSSFNSIDQELIVQLKCLRTLNLGGSGIKEVSKEIGRLIHLRYIDLSFNEDIKELPDTMSSLYNLQTLRLVGCVNLRRLDLGRLINLRHLYVDGCKNLKLLRIERLKSLQRLDTFYVPANNNEGNKFEDLKNLNQLQGRLTIYIYIEVDAKLAENLGITGPPYQERVKVMWIEEYAKLVEKVKFAENINMVNKAHLLHLQIVFEGFRITFCLWEKERETLNGFFCQKKKEILNAIQPHPGLKSLTITRYSGPTLWTDWWSSLHSLRLLALEGGSCRLLPPLGILSSLESLHMTSLHGVEKVGVEFLGMDRSDQTQTTSTFKSSFPKLKQLTIYDLPNLEEWEGVDDPENDNITIMPCLSSLTISRCGRLKALPDFLWKTPLQTLDIRYSTILQRVYGREGRGEEWAKIGRMITLVTEFCQI